MDSFAKLGGPTVGTSRWNCAVGVSWGVLSI